MAPPRITTRSTGMSPGAMGGKIGSPVTSKPKQSPGFMGGTASGTVMARPQKNDREQRRAQQQKELDQFKSNLKVAPGTTNLYQEQAPKFNPQTGKYERTTLAQKAMELSNRYGPTPRELLGDIGSGIGSIVGGLGQKFAAGELGIMGIAKGLYNQVANRAVQAKDALVKGVNKLSDIDLEFLKNEEKYPQMSSHPRIQGIKDIQEIGRTETEKADIIRQNIEQLETTPVTETTTLPQQPPGFKVMPTGAPSVSYFPGRYGATPVPNNIQQAQNPDELRRALMENTRPMPNNFPQEKPYLMQQDDYYYQDKERFSPQGNQYLYAAEGGSVDSKLNDIQKKTNNIYGTGILSVR